MFYIDLLLQLKRDAKGKKKSCIKSFNIKTSVKWKRKKTKSFTKNKLKKIYQTVLTIKVISNQELSCVFHMAGSQ